MPRLALAVLLAVSLSWSLAARAQTPEEKETARSLMDLGHKRLDEGNLAAALEAFQSADAIMEVPTTALARGQVLERLGRLTEAVDVLRRAARHPVEAGEPKAFTEARNMAAKLDKEIAERIPSVVIAVEGPPTDDVGLEVNGRVIAEATVGVPLRLDPGRHTLRITAPRHLPEEREVTLRERQTERLEVTLHPDPNAPAPAPEPATAPSTQPSTGSATGPSADTFPVPTVSIVAFAVAGAGIVAGAITGGLSLGKVSDLEEACPTKAGCAPELASDHDTMIALANASNASFAIAGAAALVGVVTLFVVEGDEVQAAAGPTGGSLTVRF